MKTWQIERESPAQLSTNECFSPIHKIASGEVEGFSALPGFRGIVLSSMLDQQLFLMQPDFGRSDGRRGPRVLRGTARISNGEQVLIGHMANYDRLLPVESQMVELPVNRAWAERLNLVAALAETQQVIMIPGGKHLSQRIVPAGIINGVSAHLDGGHDETADLIDATLLTVALSRPEIFLDATCRGFQMALALLTQQLPIEIAGHRAPDGAPATQHRIHNFATSLYGDSLPSVLRHLPSFQTNSYHKQGFSFQMLQSHLERLRLDHGIYVTHFAEDGIAELTFQIQNGRIVGMFKQFHLEKEDNFSPELLQMNQQLIRDATLL